MRKCLVALTLAVLSFLSAGIAQAQIQRMLPANAKLGEIAGRQHPFPLVLIDNKVVRLSAGAIIYDENNRTILHQLIPERAYILYTQDVAGDVTRVYILRAGELEAAKRRPVPAPGTAPGTSPGTGSLPAPPPPSIPVQ